MTASERGVRKGDRVAVVVPAIPWTAMGDQVALAQPGEQAIGMALLDAGVGELVDVLTDDRPSNVIAECFRVADRPR